MKNIIEILEGLFDETGGIDANVGKWEPIVKIITDLIKSSEWDQHHGYLIMPGEKRTWEDILTMVKKIKPYKYKKADRYLWQKPFVGFFTNSYKEVVGLYFVNGEQEYKTNSRKPVRTSGILMTSGIITPEPKQYDFLSGSGRVAYDCPSTVIDIIMDTFKDK